MARLYSFGVGCIGGGEQGPWAPAPSPQPHIVLVAGMACLILFPFKLVNPGFHSGHLFFQLLQVIPEALHFLRRRNKAPEAHATATTGHPPAATTLAVVHAAPAVSMHAAVPVTVAVTHLTHSFLPPFYFLTSLQLGNSEPDVKAI